MPLSLSLKVPSQLFFFCFVLFFPVGSDCISPLIGTERLKAVEGKMESVRHQSDKYKSKSPSETQMQTSGDGRDWGGWMGGGGGLRVEKRGRAAGEVIITSQPHSSV